MHRADVLNFLIRKHNYKSYLEIGVQTGWLFSQIECENKTGVDPEKNFDGLTFELTSNDFFKQNDKTFDIVFIDGLHWHEQVYEDFENSLKFLNKNGMILFHDCNPTQKIWQEREPIVAEWTGDCWKAFIKIRQNFDYETYTIDTDYGIGVCYPSLIQQKNDSLKYDISYEEFDIDRKNLLNLISVEDFLNKWEK